MYSLLVQLLLPRVVGYNRACDAPTPKGRLQCTARLVDPVNR